jgi:hypothetical protein
MKCTKCSRPLHDCQGCNGGKNLSGGVFGAKTCRQCNSTGQVCPEHGGHWKR